MNLQELEQKYQELGQEIERLKAETYPIYCLNKNTGVVLQFDGPTSGVVVKNNNYLNIGEIVNNSIPHTDTDVWKPLEVCPETGFYDGQLVWAWDGDGICSRILLFYDAKHQRTFDQYGNRNSFWYSRYESFDFNWPEWAQKAFKNLIIITSKSH